MNAYGAVPIAGSARPSARESVVVVQLVGALSRHRRLVLAALLLGLLAGLAVTWLTPPTYRANVRLQFEAQPATVITLGSGRQAAGRSPGDIMYDFTPVGLLRARSLAERVVRSENLANDPAFVKQTLSPEARFNAARGAVLGGIEAVQQRQTRLVDLYYSHRDPQRAAQIANAIARNFIQNNLEQGINQSAFTRDFLSRRLAEVRQSLERSERALVGYERAQGRVTIRPRASDGQVSEAESINNAQLADVATALSQATQRRIEAEQKLDAARETPGALRGAASTAGLETELAQQRARLADLRVLYRDDHPDVKAVEGRIGALEQAVGRAGGSGLTSLLSDFRAARGEERALNARLNNLRNAVLDERSRSVQYMILAREVDTTRALYNALLQRYREVGVESGVGSTQVTIVDPATVPGSPIKPVLWFNLALGGIIGLFLGAVVAYGYDMLRDVVTAPHDLEDRLGLEPLGAVPVEEGHGSLSAALNDPRSPVTEAYYAIANTLRFATDHGVPRTLVLTSTAEGEGKSSSSYGLARSLSAMGRSVLLVDADMRRPSFIDERRGAKRSGLADILSGNATLADAITHGENGIDYIFAGRTPPNPPELLAGSRLQPLVAELSAQYDIVIFDAPPILGYVDAPVLASFAEATMLVFESSRNRTPFAQSSVRKLRAAGANIIGGVITKFHRKNDQYGYAYGTGHYDTGYGGAGKTTKPDDEKRLIFIGARAGD
ncbi:GumC family protein [Sphingomonas sp.]|uniref:GumC family protein n=1 Tax=Sphingomonas sp. TaxID=28214 RepID=UPI003B3B4DAD